MNYKSDNNLKKTLKEVVRGVINRIDTEEKFWDTVVEKNEIRQLIRSAIDSAAKTGMSYHVVKFTDPKLYGQKFAVLSQTNYDSLAGKPDVILIFSADGDEGYSLNETTITWKPGDEFTKGKIRIMEENYPVGAKYHSKAPWNEGPDNTEHKVKENKYGDLEILYLIPTGPEDYEVVNKDSIDPYYVSKFLAEKFGIDFKRLDDEGQNIKINDIIKIDNDNFIFDTDYGTAKFTFSELEDMAERARKERRGRT